MLSLKVAQISEFIVLIFELFHVIKWEQRIPEKIMFGIGMANVISIYCVVGSLNTRKCF